MDDTCSIASFVRKNLPKDEKVILYRLWLWRIRSTYLFYSDRDISSSVNDSDAIIKILEEGKAKYFLTTREGFAELSEIVDLRPKVLKGTPSLVLFEAV